MSNYQERITELEAQIRSIRDEAEAERVAKRDAVTPQWRYWIELAPGTDRRFERIRDESVTMYRLCGEVTNYEVCREAGYDDSKLAGGGMNYLFNKLSGRIVMPTGGGRIYISDHTESERELSEIAFTELEAFVADYPDGGVVDEIIVRHQQRTREAKAAGTLKHW